MKLNWHTFAGGTAAAPDKYSYQAITGELNGREQYLINPVSSSRGRHLHYVLRYFGPRGYETLGKGARVPSLKRQAQEHHDMNAKAAPLKNPITGVAIETHYVGPSNFRGARIVASTESGQRITRSYDHALNSGENHEAAARALADKMGWGGELMGGGTKKGYCFVFVEGTRTFDKEKIAKRHPVMKNPKRRSTKRSLDRRHSSRARAARHRVARLTSKLGMSVSKAQRRMTRKIRSKIPYFNPASPSRRGTMSSEGSAAIRRLRRHDRRVTAALVGERDTSARYRVEGERKGRWIVWGYFHMKPLAVEYGNALKTRYPSKKFRVAWD